MKSDIIKQLHEQIDAKHYEAIRSLEILRRYLDGTSEMPTSIPQSSLGIVTRQKLKISIRNQVLEIISREPMTKNTIQNLTDLKTRQIYGVLGALDLRKKIKREESSDGTLYYYQSDDPKELKEDDNCIASNDTDILGDLLAKEKRDKKLSKESLNKN